MRTYMYLALIVLFSAVSSYAQQGLNKYQKIANYDLDFASVCEQIEATFTSAKLETTNGHAKDNDYIKFKRWEAFWRDRLTPDGKLPNYNLLDRVVKTKSNIFNRSNKKNQSTSVWEFIGPNTNTGGYWGMGRVTDIAFHPTDPNTFFVGAAKGGIWKTTNGGSSYFSIGDNLPYNSVGNIVVNKDNPNVIHITLGVEKSWAANGLGVYKTTDGGVNWEPTTLSKELSDRVAFIDMAGSPLQNNLIFVATTDGLYRTTDGTNFSLITNGLPNAVYSWNHPMEIAFHPTNPSVVYLAWWSWTGDKTNVYKSIDGGLSWNNVTNFNFDNNSGTSIAISTTSINPGKVVVQTIAGQDKRIHYSNNSGDTWTSQPVFSDLEGSPLCISPTNQSTIYSGYFYIKRSTDNGQTFQNIAAWDAPNGFNINNVHVDQWVIKVNPLNNKMYWGNDGGVYNYDEASNQWTELNNDLAITQVYRIAISQNQPDVYFFGSQDNGAGYYTPSINGWRQGNGGDATNNAIAHDNIDKGFSAYVLGGELYRTTNGWANSTRIEQNVPNGYVNNADWISPLDLDPNNSSSFIVASDEIYLSSNSGDSFTKLTNGELGGSKVRDIRFSPANGNSVYATTGNKIIETQDLGNTWNLYDSGTDSNISSISRVFPHPSDPNKLWMVRSGYSDGKKVFLSNNRGATLLNISGNLPNIPVLSLAYDEAKDILYLGTELGVYYSSASSINWELYGIGLPYTMVTDVEIHKNTRKLIVSTYGRGIWSIPLNEALSTSNQVLNLAFNIFPNPVQSELTIRSKQFFKGSYAIYNQTGQLILENKFENSEAKVNFKNVVSGIYIVLLKNTNNQVVEVKRIIRE